MTPITSYLLFLLLLMSSCDQVCGDDSYSDQNIADSNNNNQDQPPLAVTTTAGQGDGYGSSSDSSDLLATSGQNQNNLCAFYDDHPSVSSSSIELSKRIFKTEGKKPESGDRIAGALFPGNNNVTCTTYCFTFWVADPRNKSSITVSKQGCWLFSADLECHPNQCISNQPPRQNNTHFCCCTGHMCNLKFQDSYNATKGTTTKTQATPVAVGPLHDHSYKKKTIVIALVSVASVSLVIVFLYLAYRLCLTPKPASPQSSSVARVETPEPLLPEFNVDDLKIEDVIVRGRYSEVRRGKLGDKEVAVKMYQPHHRQYYYNERNAFTQPFMDHENMVKFFGAKEQEDQETSLLQYIIVTEYIPLGSLTSYLKHNTVDWYMLCHMCQGISRGLAHLHADIQKGDLFKPAIAHRDLNTRNILVNPDLTCLIADLGFSVGMIGSKIIKNGIAENAEQASLADVGTLRYMAPEVFDGAVNLRDCEASLKQIDVYALGLVIWEIASRCIDLYQGAPVPEYQLPFQAEAGTHPSFEEVQVLVVKYKTRPRFPEVWKDANPAVRSLKETIEDCWDTDAEARLTSLCVQERIADMAALWAHGTKHRGVTPTLNATMNLPESSPNCVIHSGSAVVSNGVTYLPSYIERNHEINEESGHFIQREEITSPIIPTSLRSWGDKETANAVNTGVTAPLISNVSQLGNSGSFDAEEGRVRSWLHDQSVSGSTVDTLLPPTPSLEEGGTVFDASNLVIQASDHPPIKASNVMIAKNKAVILHPNQGRNPTVERNTHKRSDEELTVSGNVLVGPGSQITNSEADRNNRRGSLGTQSAPPNRNGDSYDGMEAIESSSLVQNDSLGQHHIRPRNTPIPYFQNHVHGENVAGVTVAPYLTRPKLANISGNRSSYLRLQGEDANPNTHTASFHASEKFEIKSLKHKLSKLIRPKDFGVKLSHMVFGGKNKKGQNCDTTANSLDVESMAGRSEDTNRVPGQYINSGLDASPVNRNMTSINTATSVAMEVQLVNGSFVTLACNDTNAHNLLSHQNGNTNVGPQGRLSATNVMRLGVLANPSHEELPSPSLFPKNGVNSVVNDSSYLRNLNQENAVTLQNLVTARLGTDYGSMHHVILNQAYGLESNTDLSSTDLKASGLSSTAVIGGIQDTTVTPNYQCSAKDGSLNSNLDLTSLNMSNKYPSIPIMGQTSLPSGNSGNSYLSTTSNYIPAEPSLVSACDPGILSTVIQSPQNKTVSPVNKPLPLFSVVGCSPKVIVKKCSQDIPLGAYSSQTSTTCLGLHNHYSDTKGGNSIMHNIHVEANINHSKDTSGYSERPAKKSAKLQRIKSPHKSNVDSAKFSHCKTDEITEGTTAFSHGVVQKSSQGLSQSQSVTNLERHQNQLTALCDNTDDTDSGRKGRRDPIWQEMNMSKTFTFSLKSRPQSLSLKGHNYNRSRGRSASSSSLPSASSLPQTTKSFLQTNSGVKTNDEKGPLTVVVPNVTLDKNSVLIQSSKCAGRKPATIPKTVVVDMATNVAVSTMKSSGSSDENNHVKKSTGSGKTISDVSATQTDSSGSSSFDSTDSTASASRTNDNTGSKTHPTLKNRSDSSEKIRRRIKTPVSFKKGRLSLYDDRLMTHSLGFVSLSDMDGTNSIGGSGDNNNNSSGADVYSDNGRHMGRCQNGGSTAQITKTDYHKMIKSESDLVV